MRNMTGSPIAGIDPHEFLDVRPLNYGVPTAQSIPQKASTLQSARVPL